VNEKPRRPSQQTHDACFQFFKLAITSEQPSQIRLIAAPWFNGHRPRFEEGRQDVFTICLRGMPVSPILDKFENNWWADLGRGSQGSAEHLVSTACWGHVVREGEFREVDAGLVSAGLWSSSITWRSWHLQQPKHSTSSRPSSRRRGSPQWWRWN